MREATRFGPKDFGPEPLMGERTFYLYATLPFARENLHCKTANQARIDELRK